MERLSPSKDVAENKLLILYILEKVNTSVGSIGMTSYILEERVMSYLAYQQRVHELIAANHISSKILDGHTLYEITPAGKELLSAMNDLLPATQKNRIDRTVKKLRRRAIDERSIIANYTPDDEFSGIARISLIEGKITMLNLEIASSKEEASVICRNWKTCTTEIYAAIAELLLGAGG